MHLRQALFSLAVLVLFALPASADIFTVNSATDNVTVDGANVGKAELNPVTVGVGVGARF